MPRMQTACEQCGKIVSCYVSSTRKLRRWCSPECIIAATHLWTDCPRCGKHFWYHRSRPRKFCSHACSSAVNGRSNLHETGRSIDAVCDECGQSFRRNEAAINSTKSHFCSQRCFGINLSRTNCGENHPNWKGGEWPYYGPTWPTQRRNARRRDAYTCQQCGITEEQLGRQLDVHHIHSIRDFGGDYRAANALVNLISYCYRCHLLHQ